MKIGVSSQLGMALGILVLGGGVLVGELVWVKWYPLHQRRVAEEILAPVPYQNAGLGVSMKIAQGIYGKEEILPGEVRISNPGLLGGGPALTLKSDPNPGGAAEFSPQILAVWQTDGETHQIPRYDFEHTKVMNRDAAIIRQLRGRSMVETLRVISPTRIVEATCNPGDRDEALYMQACDESLRTLEVEGPMAPAPMPVPEPVRKAKRRKK